jgi:hypothetical protein
MAWTLRGKSQAPADLPVVLTTGYVKPRGRPSRRLEVLVKPYPLKVLARTLNAQLSRRAAAAR